ncbi:MAG: hypothetical protein AB4290_28865 [Spirulina sp.]
MKIRKGNDDGLKPVGFDDHWLKPMANSHSLFLGLGSVWFVNRLRLGTKDFTLSSSFYGYVLPTLPTVCAKLR